MLRGGLEECGVIEHYIGGGGAEYNRLVEHSPKAEMLGHGFWLGYKWERIQLAHNSLPGISAG